MFESTKTMALGSSDDALSALTSFVICWKTWKLGDPIHSTEIGAIKKKRVQTFGDAFATARAEGVFWGQGSSQKYSVKWTNQTEELISEYGANHHIFQDLSKRTSSKKAKKPWFPAIISESQPSCTSSLRHGWCIRTLFLIWWNFSCRSWRSSSSGNFFCSCRW